MKKIIYSCSALLIIALLSVIIYTNMPFLVSNKTESTSSKALIGGAFTLEDAEGVPVHDTDFRGKLMLVYFGFTYCPDVCPLGLQTISQAIELLGKEQTEIQALFITLDPERDTRKQMKSYMAHFNSHIKGLTGTKEQVAQAALAYRVYYNKVQEGNIADYLIDHSAFIYLLDGNGEYITHFPSTATADQIAEAIRKNL